MLDVGAPVQPSTKSTTVVYLVGLEVHTLGAAAAMRRARGGAILSRAGWLARTTFLIKCIIPLLSSEEGLKGTAMPGSHKHTVMRGRGGGRSKNLGGALLIECLFLPLFPFLYRGRHGPPGPLLPVPLRGFFSL